MKVPGVEMNGKWKNITTYAKRSSNKIKKQLKVLVQMKGRGETKDDIAML